MEVKDLEGQDMACPLCNAVRPISHYTFNGMRILRWKCQCRKVSIAASFEVMSTPHARVDRPAILTKVHG